MGSQCTRCKGTGFLPKSLTGNIKASDLARIPCDNPNCTVNRPKEKLGRDQLNILVRKNIVLESVKAVVSIMPMLSKDYQTSETITLANVKATELIDVVFETAHQRIGEYQSMALVMLDIDGNHYEFKATDRPECGRLTTERKAKEQPKMDITKLGDVFDPAKTDDEVKAALKAAELDLTGSPDETTSSFVSVNPVMLALEQIKAEKDAPKIDDIGALKLKLWKLIAAEFGDSRMPDADNKAQLTSHFKRALKADNFQDFIMKHMPIEKAAEVGEGMIKAYIDASMPQEAAETQSSPAATVAGDPFQPATDDGVYLKLAIAGPSGSGKSFTSLKIAREMFPEGKIAFLCTEHKAARRYAKHFKFNLMEIRDYHPQRFIDAIHDAERYGYDVLIIDSLSHEWSGSGGLLSLVDGKFGGWKEATPLHQKLIETIQEANIHIIATMRSKMEYSQEKDERTGKTVVRKVGMAPIQREQTEYEFDVYAEIEMGSELTISKSRCFELKAGKTFVEGNGLAPVLKQWIAA